MQQLARIGIITKALQASFMTEMTQVKEKIDMEKAAYQLDGNLENIGDVFEEKVSEEAAKKFDKTLMYEIVYFRNEYGLVSIFSETSADKLTVTYAQKFFKNNTSEFVEDLYYVNENMGNGKKETYIYDAKLGITYKIPNTRISGDIFHSLEYMKLALTGENIEPDNQKAIEIEGIYAKVNGISYYSPNYKNFTVDKTYAVYWDKTALADVNKVYLMPMNEFNGTREITKSGSNYILYDYENQIWANIVTKNSGHEAWWVWIPRYNYTIDSTNKTTSINFVSTSESASPSFTVDGNELQGIWVSKYEPSQSTSSETALLPYYLPDLSGFNPETTYLEIYDEETDSFNPVKLGDIRGNLKDFAKDNLWFNYDKQIWANIKTTDANVEAWWVWIPRYAYSIVGTSGTDIKFVDIYNVPVDGSDLNNFTVHPAFTIDNGDGTTTELKGIWVSKYEPSATNAYVEQKINVPDMKGYNVEKTSLEIYDITGENITKEIKLKDVLTNESQWDSNNLLTSGEIDESKLASKVGDGIWYNYNNKIWANIKTENNGEVAYWTWIPRYAYTIIGTSGTDIVFVDENDQPISENCTVSAGMIVHPAFNIVDGENTTKLEGIWVSKYEPSGTANIYTDE